MTRKEFAVERQCPLCKRKSALKLERLSERYAAFVCRWCDRMFEPGFKRQPSK